MPTPFSRAGKDFYVTGAGTVATVDAGFDTTDAYPDWSPATKEQVDARDYEKAAEALAPGRKLIDAEAGPVDADAVFGQSMLSPAVQAAPHSDEVFDAALEQETAEAGAFNALPPNVAPVAKPFTRDGKDFYADAAGKLHTVDAGFDPSEDFPDFKPATAEQVHKRDIQKRSGHLIDQVETFGHTALATTLEAGAGVYNKARDFTVDFYGADHHVRAKDIAPGLYEAKEIEQREANPTAAFLGAAVPDVGLNFLIPGEGVASTAARLFASSVVTEAGNTVIEGDEFKMNDALFVYAPVQLAFEAVAPPVLKGLAKGLGWTGKTGARGVRNALDWAVQRADSNAVADTLREVDPVKRAGLLRKNAASVLKTQQAALDDALGVIDQHMVDAPAKLFTPSALSKSVSSNVQAQGDAVGVLVDKLRAATFLTGDDTVKAAYEAVLATADKSGAAQYGALRGAWQSLTSEAASIGPSPLVREALEGIDATLADVTTWGRAARHHAGIAADTAEAATGTGVGKHLVHDVASRPALDRHLERARSVASLSGNKAMSGAVAKAEEALSLAGEVTGAKALGGALPDEVKDLRKVLDGFPERLPKLAEKLTDTLDKLDLPETWTAERVTAHLLERAGGSKAARALLDGMLTEAEKVGGKAGAVPGRAARDKAIAAARELLTEADDVHKAYRRVHEADASPTGAFGKAAHWAIDKATGKFATAAAGKATGMLGGYAMGGIPGMVAGAAAEHFIEAPVQAAAKRFGNFLKSGLRKHGKSALGVGALYGANRLAYDEENPSPNAAAAVGLLGLPLFFAKGGGKAMSIAKAMRQLDDYIVEHAIAKDDWRDAAVHLFERDGYTVYDAFKVIDRHGVDLSAKNAATEVVKALETDVPYRYAQFHINEKIAQHPEILAKADAKAAKTAATIEAKKAQNPKRAEARTVLGELGRWLDGVVPAEKRGHVWSGDHLADNLKGRLKDPAPVTFTELLGNHLRAGVDIPEHLTMPDHYERVYDPSHPLADKAGRYSGEYTAWESPERLEWLKADTARKHALMPDLKTRIDKALDGVDPTDRVSRVTIENDTIREVLRDALGMKAVVKKRLDPSVNAASRYRKAKDGFDKWRKAALEEIELDATQDWQTHEYRGLNEITREGTADWLKPVGQDRLRNTTAQLMTALNKAVKAGWTVPGRVTRGISMPQAEVDRLLKAKTVTSQGFMSTSIHATTPKGFAERRAKEFGEVPVLLTVEQETGVPLGQGEGELTLRPGTKFDVVWVEPANEKGFVTAYLREVEPSKLTAADLLAGIAGKIPTEAKVAGGLLAVSAATDDDDDSSAPLAAGVGGLALLYGGRGKLRGINSKLSLLTREIGSLAPVLDSIVNASEKQIQQVARWGQTAERGAFERAVTTLKDSIEQTLIDSAEGKAAKAAADKGEYFNLGKLGDYVHAAIDERLIHAAALEKPGAARVAGATRKFVEERGKGSFPELVDLGNPNSQNNLEEAAYQSLERLKPEEEGISLNAISRADDVVDNLGFTDQIRVALREGRDSKTLVQVYEDTAAGAVADEADGIVSTEMREHFRDVARLKIGEAVNRLVAPEVYEHAANFPAMGLRVRAGLKTFVEEEGVDATIRGAFPDAPIVSGPTKSPEEIRAYHVKHLARWRGKLTEALRGYGASVPEPLDGHLVDDIFGSMQRGSSLEEAVDEVTSVLDSGAEWVALDRDNHRHAKRAFDKWEHDASKKAGFKISDAINDYAGDWDYKNINAYSRGQLDAGGHVPNPSHEAAVAPATSSEKIAWFHNWAKGPDFDFDVDFDGVIAMAKEGDEKSLHLVDDWFETHGPKLSADDSSHDIQRAQEKATKLQHALDLAVSDGYTAPGVTYRGALLSDEHIALIAKAQNEGTEVEAHAFMSTTGNPDYALSFISNKQQLRENKDLKKILFEVVQKTGVPINESETEILLRAGTRFRVEPIDRVIATHMRDETRQHVKFRLVELDHDPKLPGTVNAASALPWVAGGVLAVGAATDDDDESGAAMASAGLLGVAALGRGKLGSWTVRVARGVTEHINLDHVADPIAKLTEMGAPKVVLERVAKRLQAGAKPLTEIAIDAEHHAAVAARNHALWDDADRAVIEHYQGSDGAQEINYTLRGAREDGADDAARIVIALDKAVDAGNVTPGTIWRGIDLDPGELDKLTQGSHVIAQGVVSGATNPRRAEYFAPGEGGRRPVIFRIEQKTGVPVTASGEDEIIMRPGTAFEIVNVDRVRYDDSPYGHGHDGAPGWRYVDTIDVREVGVLPEKSRRAFFKKHGGKIAGVAAALGGSFVSEDEAHATLKEADEQEAESIVEDAHTTAAGIDEGREQELDATREKLGYLAHQSRQAVAMAARSLASPEKLARKVPVVPGVTTSQGIARFLGSADTLREAYDSKRETLKQMAGDPMTMVDDLADDFAELHDNAPDLHAEVVAQTYKVAAFVQGKLPPVVGASLVRPEGSPPSALAIRQFALYFSAAVDPGSVIEDVTNNRARKEQVDTLRELWPDTYDKLKMAVLEQMAATRPTIHQRTRLDLLFDFGPNFDRALSPGLVAVYQAARAAQRGQADGDGATPGGGKRAPSRRTQPSVGGTGALGALALGPGGGAARG
jgi:hypothetical protein